jgi:hypothetical protein
LPASRPYLKIDGPGWFTTIMLNTMDMASIQILHLIYFNAGIVVCTHFMPLEILGRKYGRRWNPVPLHCVITDYAVHALWIVRNVDCHYVATEDAQRQPIRKGQPCIIGLPEISIETLDPELKHH